MKKQKQIYGMELVLDLYNCNPKTMSSPKKLKTYLVQLCNLIKMKRFGKPFIENFGFGKDFTAGYSIAQMIETSSITGHFSDLWRSAHINIFSCQPFNTKQAREFSKKFFQAKKVKNRVIIRH